MCFLLLPAGFNVSLEVNNGGSSNIKERRGRHLLVSLGLSIIFMLLFIKEFLFCSVLFLTWCRRRETRAGANDCLHGGV